MPTGLGDEQLWLSATNDNTGTSTAFNDQSGNGNNGTASGTLVVADTSAGGSYAFSLNGTSDYIDVVSSGVPAAAYSVSVWQNSSRSSNASNIVFNAGDLSNNRVVNLDGVRNGTSGDSHGHRSSGTNYFVANTANRSQNTWYHYLLTYDGNALRIYVDGTLINTRTGVPSTTYTETKCWIGQYIGTGFFFQGMLDDLRTYNRVLTQAEITHLASQRGVEGPAPVGLGDEKLWLCPSLNNSAGDISGNGNDGTYQGGMGTIADTSNGGSLAYDFDGVDDYIDVVSSGVPATAYSVSLWQYSISSSVNTALNAGDGNNRNVNIDAVRAGNSGDNHGHKSSGTSYWIANNTVRSSATWYHYLLTYDGNRLSIYVDGVLINSRINVPNTTYTETKCWIGQYIGTGAFFQGRMDDIRTYDRALTQAEITHLASQRGVEGKPFEGLGDEQLWLSATNDNTGTSTAFQDQSGNGNNGTASGTLVVADTSEGGTYAYGFDGVNDYIDLGQTLDVEYMDEVSYSFWMRADDGVGSFQTVMGKMLSSGTYRGHLVAYRGSAAGTNKNNGITFVLRSDQVAGELIEVANSGGITAGQWTHVAVTYDGSAAASGVEIYIDGVQSSKYELIDNQGTTTTVTTAPYNIGSRNTNSAFFEGGLDDMRQYNRVLTQAEITHLASQRGVEGPPPVGLGDEKLWLCPSLNDLSSDISGNGRNVTSTTGTVTLVADTDSGGSFAAESSASSYQNIADFGSRFASPFSDPNPSDYTTWLPLTISFWEKGGSVGNPTVWCGEESSTNTQAYFKWYSGRYWRFNGANAQGYLDNGTSPTGWNHYVCTQDRGGQYSRLYINGVLVAESTLGDNTHNSGANTLANVTRIGNFSGSGTVSHDDIRVYSRNLTQAEITHLATSRGIEGSPDTCGLITDMTYWSDLSDGTSASLADDNGGTDVLTRNGGTTDATGSPGSGPCVDYGTASLNYHTVNAGASLAPPPSEYSVSVWCYFQSASSTGNWVVNQRDASTGDHWQIFRWPTGNIAVYELGTVDRLVEAPSSLGQWYHVSFSRTDVALSVYLNGSLVGTDTAATAQNTGSSPIAVGTPAWNQGSTGLHHNGSVWGLGMWDRELTAAEHWQLYAGGQGLLYSDICTNPPVTPDVFFNPFKSHTFHAPTGKRIR